MSAQSTAPETGVQSATTGGESPKSSASAPTWAARRHELLERLSGEWRLVPVLVSLAAIWIFFALQTDVFLGSRNLSNLSAQIAVTSIIALGLVLVLIVAEIDLSVAALSAVSAAITAKLVVQSGVPAGVGVAIGLAAGAGIGLVQGAVVTTFGAPAFIVTLGGSLALQGLLLTLLPADTGLIPLSGTPLENIAGSYLSGPVAGALVVVATLLVGALRWQSYSHRRAEGLPSSMVTSVVLPTVAVAAGGALFVAVLNAYRGVPTPIVIVLLLLAVFFWMTTQTRFGTYLYAIGDNAEAARRAGIPVGRVKLTAFVLVGMLSAIGGIVAASRVLAVSPQSGESTLLLEAVAAAVIGGASLFGGRGSVWAALLGALVIGSISNGMFLINASTEMRLAVEGFILVVAVVADAVISRGTLRAR
jgi:D-xylose transport system permease protein